MSDPDTLDFLEIGGVEVDDPSLFTPTPETNRGGKREKSNSSSFQMENEKLFLKMK